MKAICSPRAVSLKFLHDTEALRTKWQRFEDSIVSFLPEELSIMKIKPNIEIRPESLAFMYTEHWPLKSVTARSGANGSIIALLNLVPSEGFSSRIRDKPSEQDWVLLL